MKRKIRITKAPQYREGGQTIGSQLNYGLYRGGLLKTHLNGTETSDDDVRTTYPAVDRQEANIEVEGRGKFKKGEKIIMPDMSKIYDFRGPTHEQGGIPVNAEPGSYIMSDHITGDHEMQEQLGFTPPSSKAKKHNTWAKILDRKVPTKDYNRLSDILEKANAGKEVDKYELATAMQRMPGYQTAISNAVLGNELSKGMQGKEMNIPDMAQTALQKFMSKMGGQPDREQEAEETPMTEARYGGSLPQYQSKGKVDLETQPQDEPSNSDNFYVYGPQGEIIEERNSKGQVVKTFDNSYPWAKPWTKSNTVQGRTTPTGKSSLYDNSVDNQYQNIDYWVKDAQQKGVTINNLQDLQKYVYNEIEKENPDAIKKMWTDYGHTAKSGDQNVDNFADNIMGRRSLELFKQKRKTPPVTTQDTPPAKTDPPPVTNTPPGQQTTTTTTIAPSKDVNFTGAPPMQKIGPYAEDVNNMGLSAINYFDRHNRYPKVVRPDRVHIDPVFGSDRAQIAANQSVAQGLADTYAYTGVPTQQLASVLSGIQGNMAPTIAQIKAGQNQQDVATDMGVRQFNAQSDMQSNLNDANLTNKYLEDVDRLMYNIDQSNALGRTRFVNDENTAISHLGDAKLFNYRFPQYAFNPSNYDVFFKSGYGKDVYGSAGSGKGSGDFNSTYKSIYDSLTNLSGDDDLRRKTAIDLTNDQLGYSGKSRATYDPYGMLKSRSVSQANGTQVVNKFGGPIKYKQGGSFIPVYRTTW